jgi:Glycosyl transferase family 2
VSTGLSVIVPAHDPRIDYLGSALGALRAQTLATSRWELLMVDNKSEPALQGRLDLGWHPNARIVREESLGLTRARLAGFEAMQGELAVLVDDDNVLAPDYLEQVLGIAGGSTFLGVWGGVIEPRFEAPELAPPQSLFALLTLRTAAMDLWSNDIGHHASTPWGAGLCVRHTIALQYAHELRTNPHRQALDLQGNRLLYGGDTDIAYTACRMGLGKGVFTRLKLEHLIPASRCTAEYLCRVAEGRGYSEVLHELALNGRLPAASSSFGAWLRRQYRLLRLNSLERAAMGAHERGRRLALRELAHAG